MDTVGAREKALACQTLAPFLCSLVGHVTFVELRNGNQARGLIVSTDAFMNVTMESVTLCNSNGVVGTFPFFFIQNKFIEMISIPPQVDAATELINQVDVVTGAKRRKEIKEAKEKRAKFLRMKEKRRHALLD